MGSGRHTGPAAYPEGMANPVIACPSCGTKNRVPVVAHGRPRCASCRADLPWLVEASDANLDAALDTGALVVLDLWAPWCGPCRLIAPVLESLSREFAGQIKVVKVNVDDSPMAARRFDASSIPLVVLLDGGTVVDTMIGAQPAPIMRSRITGALARRA